MADANTTKSIRALKTNGLLFISKKKSSADSCCTSCCFQDKP